MRKNLRSTGVGSALPPDRIHDPLSDGQGGKANPATNPYPSSRIIHPPS
jgi:hypothetical protein